MGLTAYFQYKHTQTEDSLSVEPVTDSLQVVSNNLQTLSSTLSEEHTELPSRPLAQLQQQLVHFQQVIDQLSDRIVKASRAPEIVQPSLFAFDNARDKNNELSKQLEEKTQLCLTQQNDIVCLTSRLQKVEEDYAALKEENKMLKKRLDTILHSFDATLGS